KRRATSASWYAVGVVRARGTLGDRRSGDHASGDHALENRAPDEAGFAEAASLGKPPLRALADRLLHDDPDAVERSIAFFVLETRGLWHGRARSLIARRLKHRTLTADQAD